MSEKIWSIWKKFTCLNWFWVSAILICKIWIRPKMDQIRNPAFWPQSQMNAGTPYHRSVGGNSEHRQSEQMYLLATVPENHPLIPDSNHQVGIALPHVENTGSPYRELRLLHLQYPHRLNQYSRSTLFLMRRYLSGFTFYIKYGSGSTEGFERSGFNQKWSL